MMRHVRMWVCLAARACPAPCPAARARRHRALGRWQARAFREEVAALRMQHAPLCVRHPGGDFPFQLTGEACLVAIGS